MIKTASHNSLRSSVSSTSSDRGARAKTNFIERNIMNVKSSKKADIEPNLVQINCLNEIRHGSSSQSSMELFEQIETIETNDENFLPQGDQFEALDDQVNICRSQFFDRNKIRSQFAQKFSNSKKREIVPTLIDSGFSQTSDLSHLDTFTHQFHSDLDTKLSSVMKHLETLKSYEETLVPRLLDKKFESNSEMESDRLKHLELVQENQFKLMSQLIDKLRPVNSAECDLNVTKEPRVKSIQFNDTVEVVEAKKRSKSRSKSAGRKAKSGSSNCEVCVGYKNRSKSPNNKIRSPSKNEKKFLQELIETVPKSPDVSLVKAEVLEPEEKVSLFDEFLSKKNSENLSDVLRQSNELLSELERQEEIHRRIKEEYSRKAKSSMFADIKEVLKKVEVSKQKIDCLVDELNRKKKCKMVDLYSVDVDENEELKIKKMVDGCINAISNDVKKAVNQKMIDDSKHIKLEAERDTASKRPSRVSSQRTSNQPSGPKPKQISNVHKYLGKIYGKSVLDQIKMDEVEEKNRRFREEAEQRKKKISIDKTKKIQPASQKVQSRPSRIKPVEPVMQRPAFISIPVQPYPENQIKNFDQIHRADNIGMVTILPREKSPSKAFNITRQVLPSMSINPARSSSGEKKTNFKQIEIKVQEDENDQEVDEEETGLGINVLGARIEEKEAPKEDVPVPLPGDLSADRQQFLTDRNLSENRVLDWLEQEILKNFLLRLQVGQESEDESGVDNFRLLVDVGQDIDPDLIECLTREVLNEKIAAMIDRQDEETLSEVVDQPPVASIRKSLEFLEKKKEKSEFIEVSTPKVTPPLSPITVENFEPQPAKKESEIQLIQFINDEETESVLEISLEESDNEENFDQVLSSKSIMIPPTPRETPQPSPEPPKTPSLSERTEPPAQIRQPSPPPPQLRPLLIDSSIQCDPEPKSDPKPVIIEKIITREPKVVESESEVTKSTSSYSTTDTTTTVESDKTESVSDSYFSEGAWLLSKSEGEIVKFNNNDYVNLDLEAAAKGLILNPRLKKQSDLTSNSEGEIRMDKMNSDNTRAYAGMKARTGVNMISAEKEKGEVGSVSRRGSEKSEGEVMNPAIEFMNKKNELINQSIGLKSKSKKIVSLSVSPEKKNAKNNIKIKPIVNEVVVRDSNDFERKIFASTPDTSLFMSNQLASSNQILNDSYDLQIENSNLKRSKNSILISTNFSTTKIDDDDDDTLNNTSDLEEH